jgi:hypothetical protein
MGSYIMPKVRNGDYVPMDPWAALKANFEDIEALSPNRDFPAEFNAFKENIFGPSGKPQTQELLNALAERDRDLVTASLFAVSVTNEFFGDLFSSGRTDQARRSNWAPIDPYRNDSLYTKELSETAEVGVCHEYSLFAQEVLSLIGEDVALATGFQQPTAMADQDGFMHTFLSADEGRTIIDPFYMAALNTEDSTVPRGIYKSVSEETFLSNPTAAIEYMDLAGDTSRYSAAPIAGAEVSAAPEATSGGQG